MSLTLKSAAFTHQGKIPTKYTCEGEDVSPALAWSGAPPNTQSFVLIVDDEAHIRSLIQRTVEEVRDKGVEFLSADNGQTALELIEGERPRLVAQVPRMNQPPSGALFAPLRLCARMDGASQQIEEFQQCSPHLVAQRLGQGTHITPE